MAFVSLQFLIFFVIVFILFYSVRGKYRVAVLFLASLFFIASFSPAFLVYALVFTTLNFIIGKSLSVLSGDKRRYIYYVGQLFNIGGLVFYKYINFLLENVNYSLNFFTDAQIPYLNILIPVGISYYTFQGISYLYLIFKAKDKPESNFWFFGLYMIFFPKLLAGPIERHRIFLLQLSKSLSFDYDRVVSGGRLVMWGMFKKVVVADTFAIILTKVYGNIDSFEGMPLLIVFFIQPAQIYFDFSGYTDMALGLGKIFGLNLTDNFNRPFMSRSVGEFWRRWHISLSLWFNDFVYNRLMLKHRKWGNNAVIYAIFVSFILIGLWHGAKWTFIFLGLMQVVALIYEFKTKRWRNSLKQRVNPVLLKWVSRIFVYLFFGFTLIFFFAHKLSDVWYFIQNMFTISDIYNTHYGFNIIRGEFFVAILFAMFIMTWDYIQEDLDSRKMLDLLSSNIVLRWGIYIVWLFLVVYFSKNEAHFVYMQF